MDAFCGTEFWNISVTWNTDDPDLTKCFEKTVMVWAPCLFLWTLAGLGLHNILQSKNRDIKWNILNISKLVVNALLLILTIVDLGVALNWISVETYEVYHVDIYTPLIKIVTFALAGILVFYHRKYGIQSSGILFLFWFFCLIFGVAQFRTEIRSAMNEVPDPYYFYISYLIYYPLVVLMFLLNCFADGEPQQSKYPKQQRPCPEDASSFLSQLFFSWFNVFVWKGFKKPLVAEDMWNINHEDATSAMFAKLDKHWQDSLKRHKRKGTQANILTAIVRTFGQLFLYASVLKICQDLLMFVGPQLLKLLIGFVEEEEPQWRGIFYAVLMFATALTQTIFLAQAFRCMTVIGVKIRAALVSAIYQKALKLSNSARKERTVGEIINLVAVDAQKFYEVSMSINMLYSAPLQILLAFIFLWDTLGPSVLAGLAVIIVMIPINGIIASKIKRLQRRQMKNKDERVKLMNEILNGIKVLKLYAWEPSFEEQILKIRHKEITVLKKAAYLKALTMFLFSCAPFLVAIASFTTFVLIDENNVLDAKTAFVSLSLFNILRGPLGMLPTLITNLIQVKVSIDRINKFMNCEELDPNNISHDKKDCPLIIENGTFSWGEDPILKNINFRCTPRSLTAVVGTVGSGKSSLISALLGEMNKTSGKVNTIGSIGYVAQQAWIQNDTVQANILFGKQLNRKRYEAIIEACALIPDLDMLPAGDQTEIGEKGINLSGGQKQRISLARAVYADSDIYFLDDPLSAVDSHVGKHIFDKVVGPQGLLRDKTRILVTHSITYLSQTDEVVVLSNGEISEAGTYQELLSAEGAFAEFLNQHINEALGQDHFNNFSDSEKPNDLVLKLQRAVSKISESDIEQANCNRLIKRQKSTDSGNTDNSSSQHQLTNGIKLPVIGEKLIRAEKSKVGNVKWAVYKHYIVSIGLGLAATTLGLNILFQVFSISSNFWLSEWSTDEELQNNSSQNTAKRDMYLGVYGALGFAQALAALIFSATHTLGCINASKMIHSKLLSNALHWPMHYFDTTPIGRILNIFSSDVNSLDNTLPQVTSELINQFLKLVATLTVISFTAPYFAIVIIPIGIVYILLQRLYVATSRQLKRLDSVSKSPIFSHFGETIIGAVAIRAFGEQKRFIKETEAKIDLNQSCLFPFITATRWLGVRMEMMGSLIVLFAALFAVLGKNQNAGLVGLSISYALQITQTLNLLVRVSLYVETHIVAVERIKQISESEQEASWEIQNKKPALCWPEIGQVEFRDYAVRYRQGLGLVLNKISFTVKGGEKVGIVGRTGAGKSSLTLALFRILEAAGGEIIIDGINIAQIGLRDLRSKLTIIPQDPVLFSGSLRINLDPFDKYTDNEVWQALEQAHLKEFAKGLSAGLNHEVTEGGENLSVGQRQLICLARALLRKTKVLILDEATAAVDLETDDLIQRTIRIEFSNCTVLTIAHRMNTIMDSDRVIVLDKGCIEEFDSPQNLLQNKQSIFYGLCKDARLV